VTNGTITILLTFDPTETAAANKGKQTFGIAVALWPQGISLLQQRSKGDDAENANTN